MRKKIGEQLKAVQLRLLGKSLNEISKELRCAKSSVSLWVRGVGPAYECKKVSTPIDPNFCKSCGKEISPRKVYCDLNCYANAKPKPKCLNCENKTSSTRQKFCCVNCSIEYKWKLRIEQVKKTGMYPKYQHTLRKLLLSIKEHRCEICGNTEWLGEPIPLVADHINGNHEDNRVENLRLVCGNCDMKLPTYKSKNRGRGRKYDRDYRNRVNAERRVG